LPVFRRQAPTTAGAVLLGQTQLQLDRPLIPRPYRNFHTFQTDSVSEKWVFGRTNRNMQPKIHRSATT
jgi:hypothetical protein